MKKRTLGILEYFFTHKGEVSIKEMTEFLGANERTVRHDIDVLNEKLLENFLPTIEKSGKGLLRMEEITKVEALFFERKDMEENFTKEYKDILILVEVAFKESIKISELCEKFSLSRTTIKTALKEVKLMLDVYSLELDINPQKGLILKGREEDLRRLQLKLVNQYISIKDEFSIERNLISQEIQKYFPPLKDEVETIHRFINYVINSLERVISDEAYTTIKNYLRILIVRVQNNSSLSTVQNEKFFSETLEYETIVKGVPLLENNYEIQLNSFEKVKLAEYFLGSHSYTLDSSFYKNWFEIEFLVKDCIENFTNISNFHLTEDKTLFEGLINHIKPAIYRTNNKIELQNSILTEFLQYYPEIYHYTQEALNPLEKSLNLSFSDDEIAFLAMHFKGSMDRNKIPKKERKNILIVCGMGYGTTRLLAQQVKENYSVNIVDMIPANQISKYENNTKIDLVLTTLTSLETTLKVPVVSVKALLEEKDFSRLEEYNLSKYNKKIFFTDLITEIEKGAKIENKKILFQSLKNILGDSLIDDTKNQQFKLSDFLKEENIFLNIDSDSWKDTITKSGNLLNKLGIAENSYTQSMIENIEKNGSYLVITDLLALPHGKNSNNVNFSGMVLVTLKKPVMFPQNKPVDTLLVFASQDNQEHMNSLTEFLELVKKYNFLTTIRKAESSKKVVEQIQKYEFLSLLGKK